MIFANVIVDISHEKLDKTFQYIIPEHLQEYIRPGVRVDIPFGKGNRIISGYVVEVTSIPEFEIDKMKELKGVRLGSKPIESQFIALAAWMKEHTGCTLNQALKTVIPVKQEVKGKENITLMLAVNKEEAKKLYLGYSKRKNTFKRAELIKYLIENKTIEKNLATQKLNVTEAIIREMIKSEILKTCSSKIYRNPLVLENATFDNCRVELNQEQIKIVNNIKTLIENEDKRPHLIHGVTGSGKTEVYMELIEYMLKRNKQVIVLIPEISLTYQTVMRFYSRFGENVAIINSKLSAGERHDQFERAKKGEANIMVGPRSALFTPFTNLGLIIVDEEQENAYKSETAPRYHAVDTAIKRAELANAYVILGSATPSLISYSRALSGRYILHELSNRAMGNEMASVSVVDMREELKKGNKSMFSVELDRLIKNRLENNQQVMLFINRRGYANFVSCRACGIAIKCPHCDVSLKYHKDGVLRCHYCGYEKKAPDKCPDCGSNFIAPFGTGTQKVEEAVNKRYPNARVLRMDMDTTTGKEGHNRIIEAFANHEADILIGTQMIVKGHDFPNVTLVGIIAADLSLYASEYTASEKTFQLLTQAAGRAGRGKAPGNVVIQTYNPDESCIQTAAAQDYKSFYEQEIAFRKMMKYPPVSGMMKIQMLSENEEQVKKLADRLYKKIKEYNNQFLIIGPSKASIYKINDVFRYMIYIKGNEEMLKLQDIIDNTVNEDYSDVIIMYDYENI